MATKPKQYVETMEEAYSYMQREWEGSGWKLLGTRGFCAEHLQSVRKSHPALPIFMNALAGLVVASNGAMLRLWGATMPLALWVVNIHDSQARKSGLSAIVLKCTHLLLTNGCFSRNLGTKAISILPEYRV